MARKILPVSTATNEGQRGLRELLRRSTLGQLARRLACTPSAVRKWAAGVRTPSPEWRARLEEVLGIRADAWEHELELVVDGERSSAKSVPDCPEPSPTVPNRPEVS